VRLSTIQQFCQTCRRWFNEKCLKAAGEHFQVEGVIVVNTLTPGRGKDWMMVRTSVRHELVTEKEGGMELVNKSSEEQ
jgi:hypothetical protein